MELWKIVFAVRVLAAVTLVGALLPTLRTPDMEPSRRLRAYGIANAAFITVLICNVLDAQNDFLRVTFTAVLVAYVAYSLWYWRTHLRRDT